MTNDTPEDIDRQLAAARKALQSFEDNVDRKRLLLRLRTASPAHPLLLIRFVFGAASVFSILVALVVLVTTFLFEEVARTLLKFEAVIPLPEQVPALPTLIGIIAAFLGFAWITATLAALSLGREAPMLPWEQKQHQKLFNEVTRLTTQKAVIERIRNTPAGARPRLATPVPVSGRRTNPAPAPSPAATTENTAATRTLPARPPAPTATRPSTSRATPGGFGARSGSSMTAPVMKAPTSLPPDPRAAPAPPRPPTPVPPAPRAPVMASDVAAAPLGSQAPAPTTPPIAPLPRTPSIPPAPVAGPTLAPAAVMWDDDSQEEPLPAPASETQVRAPREGSGGAATATTPGEAGSASGARAASGFGPAAARSEAPKRKGTPVPAPVATSPVPQGAPSPMTPIPATVAAVVEAEAQWDETSDTMVVPPPDLGPPPRPPVEPAARPSIVMPSPPPTNGYANGQHAGDAGGVRLGAGQDVQALDESVSPSLRSPEAVIGRALGGGGQRPTPYGSAGRVRLPPPAATVRLGAADAALGQNTRGGTPLGAPPKAGLPAGLARPRNPTPVAAERMVFPRQEPSAPPAGGSPSASVGAAVGAAGGVGAAMGTSSTTPRPPPAVTVPPAPPRATPIPTSRAATPSPSGASARSATPTAVPPEPDPDRSSASGLRDPDATSASGAQNPVRSSNPPPEDAGSEAGSAVGAPPAPATEDRSMFATPTTVQREVGPRPSASPLHASLEEDEDGEAPTIVPTRSDRSRALPPLRSEAEPWMREAHAAADALLRSFPPQATIELSTEDELPFTLRIDHATPALAVRSMVNFVEFLGVIPVPPKARILLLGVASLDRSFRKNVEAALDPYFKGEVEVTATPGEVNLRFANPDIRWVRFPRLPLAT